MNRSTSNCISQRYPLTSPRAHWYLAIICNVSSIQRKPVLEDFEAPRSRTQEPSESSVNPATASDIEDCTTLPSAPDSRLPAEDKDVPSQQEEDANLFEETISLIDRDDTGGTQPSARADEADAMSLETKDDILEDLEATADANPTIQDQLVQGASLTKNKTKRKAFSRRDPEQPVVVVLDSLGGMSRSGAVRTLKDWIAAEGKSKRGMEAVIKENGYYPKSSQIPMQNNWSDCGVYLLGYVEKFFQNPEEFMHKLLTGSMSAKEDWPELKPSEMRHKIRDIIFDCYNQQEEARKDQKKTNKEPAKPKVLPGSTAQQTTQLDGAPSLAGHVSSEKSPSLKSNDEHGDHAQDETPVQGQLPVSSFQLELGSPLELHKEHTPANEDSPWGRVMKISDSPPIVRSPVEKSFGAQPFNQAPRRHSPEVHIASRASQYPGSIDNDQTGANLWNKPAPRSPTLSKRQRHDDDDHARGLPNAKRSFFSPPRGQNRNGNSGTQALFPHSWGEGSARNMPIEIEDSQEMEAVGPVPSRHVQRPLAHGKLSPHLQRRMQTLRDSPSFEEIPRPSSRVDSRNRGPRGAVNHGHDSVDAISQSTDQMQLDQGESDSVRETPEPRRRSPTG